LAEELHQSIINYQLSIINKSQKNKIKKQFQSIFQEKWPKHDVELVKDDILNLVIQVNGKLRDTIKVSSDIPEEDAKKIALESKKIQKWTEGKEIKKIIFVKGKLINVVV
ncbi:leucine--tRNA ligase, partial [Patescibacteria group bacterium]|nr:leucine--tRNA ligase [Patescibacteria group bacterium]